ncbi:hypothetical protein F2Q70_00028337 [Brassica cretica]|uniref:Uncharacterized protein n=1 Tax=Brassica cretica TaxID=69181 RepID=A0A8S9LGX3_BRACR|nr:hypothetical protein F2Q70_00028337 [Brassica cretica]
MCPHLLNKSLAGIGIVTASADCSILATDVETGASVAHLEHAHEDAFNTLITVTETTIASGDDQGCVKVCAVIFSFVFDHFFYSLVGILPNRIIQPIGSHEFPIEDLVLSRMITSFLVAQLMTLWDLEEIIEGSNGNASGGDSDSDNEEMDLDNDPKPSRDFHPSKNLVATGLIDGHLHLLVGILPNRIIQPIGSHEFPIEDLALSRMITSFLVAQLMTLWDLEEIIEGSNGNASGGDSDSDNEEMDLDNDPKPSRGTKRKTKSKPTPLDTKTSFFADM